MLIKQYIRYFFKKLNPKIQNHNKLMNKILLVSEKDLQIVINDILSHLLAIVQIKHCRQIVIAMLTKFIEFLKFYEKILNNKANNSIGSSEKLQAKQKVQIENQKQKQRIVSEILTNIVDIILLTQNKTKSSQTQSMLRIIQTTFSLIDYQFVQSMQYSLLTKIYSISFDCCSGGPILQNISISCLFSLTQTVFNNVKKLQQSHLLLENFLQYLFRSKKFSWIKEADLNGLIWDLVITGIKNSKCQNLQKFIRKQSNLQLINLMYKIAAQKAFNPKFHSKVVPQSNKKEKSTDNSINFKHDQTSQFIRCYKAFIILSIQYSLLPLQSGRKQEHVPFRDNIKLFKIIYDQERNYKMYIMLQGIFMLIDKYPEFPINQDNGYILFQMISKISEQLCLCNQKIDCSLLNQKSYLNKFYYGDLNSINDGDFVKIIRNSIVHLRKKFQYIKNQEENQSPKSDKNNQSSVGSQRSQIQENKGQIIKMSLKKRWEKFIKCIIKIIRYISSISILSENDQQPVRKIILQLQHWFLICPIKKIKNLILQQLLITTSTLKTKPQAIKVSQCIQIGSNLIYGYYDMLDSIGLTIIMKMMASIKAQRQDGKQYEELQEVFNMSQKLYLQQKIVKSLKNFQMTIQAFVQCSSSLLADLQQPNSNNNTLKKTILGKNPSQKYYKMIDYILEKLNIVILQNPQFLFNQWNFLTGFWMSFCSNKNYQIQVKTIGYIGYVVQKLLQSFTDKQEQIISIYLQLAAKCSLKNDFKIQFQIISQIKDYIPLLQNQEALMQTFTIIKILQTQVKDNQNSKNTQYISQQKKFISELSELQETFIKQGIHRIKKLSYLANILKGVQVLGNQKNEQYKIFTLLWNFADHLRNLSNIYKHDSKNAKQLQEYEDLWKQVFYKIAYISGYSLNAQTKQSSIHTFTQIIAQNSPVLGDSLLIELYEKIFIDKLFLNLVEDHNNFTNDKQNHSNQINLKVDMIKAASKNFIKLTKKFILQNIFKEPKLHVDFSLNRILQILKASNHIKQIIPVQILYQFLVCIQKILTADNIDNKYVNPDLIEKILRVMNQIGERVDQKTILWRKKYFPHYQEVTQTYKKIFNIQNKEQNKQIIKDHHQQNIKQQVLNENLNQTEEQKEITSNPNPNYKEEQKTQQNTQIQTNS